MAVVFDYILGQLRLKDEAEASKLGILVSSVTTYTDDLFPKIDKIAYADGVDVNYTYDKYGNEETITDGTNTVTIAYDKNAGKPVSHTVT